MVQRIRSVYTQPSMKEVSAVELAGAGTFFVRETADAWVKTRSTGRPETRSLI